MEIIINSKEIRTALTKIKLLIKKSTVFRIATLKNYIKIETANSSFQTKQFIKSNIIEKGSCLIPISEMLEFIGSTDTSLAIISDDEQITIKMNDISINFNKIPEQEFVTWDLSGESIENEDSLISNDIKKLNKIIYAIDKKDSNNLNNIAIINGDIVASDGYRLALEKTEKMVNSGNLLLLPYEISKTIYSVMKDYLIKIKHYKNYVYASNTSIEIMWKKNNEGYPNYKQIVDRQDKSPMSVAILNKKQLQQSLSTIKSFAEMRENTICLSFSNNNLEISTGVNFKKISELTKEKINKNKLEDKTKITKELTKYISSSVVLPIINVKEVEFFVILNHTYLTDMVNAIKDKEIMISYFGDRSPILGTSANKKEYNIIMPKIY